MKHTDVLQKGQHLVQGGEGRGGGGHWDGPATRKGSSGGSEIDKEGGS